MGNTNRNSLTPRNEVIISLYRFSKMHYNSINHYYHFRILFLSESDKNIQTADKIFYTLKESMVFIKSDFTWPIIAGEKCVESFLY